MNVPSNWTKPKDNRYRESLSRHLTYGPTDKTNNK